MEVPLPDDLNAFVQEQAAAQGHGDPARYIVERPRADSLHSGHPSFLGMTTEELTAPSGRGPR